MIANTDTDGTTPIALAGPDFICAGMQKAGTQWLYDQLQFHPEFWMPPIKELHFFDDPEPRPGIMVHRKNYLADQDAEDTRRRRKGHRPLDGRDYRFFESFDAAAPRWGSLEAYARLFEPKGTLLSGDVTPGYSTLDADLVETIANAFPRTRALVVIRDPVERLISQLRMEVARSLVPSSTLSDVSEIASYLELPRVWRRAFPSAIVPRWQAAFGDRFALFFFDDLAEDPTRFRNNVLSHIGARDVACSSISPHYNRKARQLTTSVSAGVRDAIGSMLAEERRRCADLFGGRAIGWSLRRP